MFIIIYIYKMCIIGSFSFLFFFPSHFFNFVLRSPDSESYCRLTFFKYLALLIKQDLVIIFNRTTILQIT